MRNTAESADLHDWMINCEWEKFRTVANTGKCKYSFNPPSHIIFIYYLLSFLAYGISKQSSPELLIMSKRS